MTGSMPMLSATSSTSAIAQPQCQPQCCSLCQRHQDPRWLGGRHADCQQLHCNEATMEQRQSWHNTQLAGNQLQKQHRPIIYIPADKPLIAESILMHFMTYTVEHQPQYRTPELCPALPASHQVSCWLHAASLGCTTSMGLDAATSSWTMHKLATERQTLACNFIRARDASQALQCNVLAWHCL